MKTITSFSIVLILSLLFISAEQARVITGRVIDENGAVLTGVTVVEKGSSNSVLTDGKGEYLITVSSGAKALVFSFTGMETKEVRIKSSNRIDVVMQFAVLEFELSEEDDIGITSGQGLPAVLTSMSPRSKLSASKSTYAGAVGGVYYQQQGDWNTESYSTIHENGFKDVLHNPLSTFSIDVDKASYSNVRRMLNMGQRPPVDAIRVEELINYFTYDYPQPDGDYPFTVSTELSECPWNSSHQLLHIGLQGKSIEKENLPPSNIVFLVDVSGSMSDQNKLPLLKSAFRLLVNELRTEDRVAMVVYAGAAGEVLESTPGDEKSKIIASLDNLQAGGSTAGGAGIKLAYKIASEHFIEGGNNRIILATDGDFNIGQSSDAEMERLIEKEREKGIFITVLGFGMGNYKDSKMETIADKGNGNYAYIDNIQEANKVFVSEFGGTLFTIAKDVKFQIEFNPAVVKGYRLVGYENRLLNDEDFNDDTKDAGEMGAGHTVTAMYEIIPAESDEAVADIDPLKYQDDRDEVSSRVSDELMTVKIRYKEPDGQKSSLFKLPVKNKMIRFEKASENLRFAAAVAQFGMLLRESEYVKQGTLEDVLKMAREARGEDYEGYRGEFIQLVNTSSSLLATTAK
ncbi:von Willebrand factor type A domain-containing protein [Bacteroidota bacterium]